MQQTPSHREDMKRRTQTSDGKTNQQLGKTKTLLTAIFCLMNPFSFYTRVIFQLKCGCLIVAVRGETSIQFITKTEPTTHRSQSHSVTCEETIIQMVIVFRMWRGYFVPQLHVNVHHEISSRSMKPLQISTSHYIWKRLISKEWFWFVETHYDAVPLNLVVRCYYSASKQVYGPVDIPLKLSQCKLVNKLNRNFEICEKHWLEMLVTL